MLYSLFYKPKNEISLPILDYGQAPSIKFIDSLIGLYKACQNLSHHNLNLDHLLQYFQDSALFLADSIEILNKDYVNFDTVISLLRIFSNDQYYSDYRAILHSVNSLSGHLLHSQIMRKYFVYHNSHYNNQMYESSIYENKIYIISSAALILDYVYNGEYLQAVKYTFVGGMTLFYPDLILPASFLHYTINNLLDAYEYSQSGVISV